MKPKIYIDGKEGTTGLQIYERLGDRGDIQLMTISDALRKDTAARGALLNAVDLVFLCLPDGAAREAVSLIKNPDVKVIDASAAHRTAPGWTYGFPELGREHRASIAASNRVANPGCHATGFIAITAPLVKAGFIDKTYPVTCYSLTGYSGGGKKMIAQYTAEDRPPELDGPRLYGLDLSHKHIPEMMAVTGLTAKPLFSPVVADYYGGMAVTVMLPSCALKGRPEAEDIRDFFGAYYGGEQFIKVQPFGKSGAFLNANAYADTNLLEISVHGGREQTLVSARFDNLGKGASGAAVQNMNLMLGFEAERGLA